MPQLGFKVLGCHDDSMLQLQVTAADSIHSAIHETYIYPEAIELFGEHLKAFPSNEKADVLLESGGPGPQCHDYMRLRVFLLAPNGRSALEVDFDTHGIPPALARCHFYLTGEPAAFNRLGEQVCNWIRSPNDQVILEWRDV